MEVLDLVQDLLVDLVVVVVEILMGLLLVVLGIHHQFLLHKEIVAAVDSPYLEVVEVVLEALVHRLHHLLVPEIVLRFQLGLVDQVLHLV